MMITLIILEAVGSLIIIIAGILKAKEHGKMDFTNEESDILLLVSRFCSGEEVRKTFHTRRSYALSAIMVAGFCLLFFLLAATAIIILYVLGLNQPVQLVILPLVFLIFILLNLAFLSLISLKILSEKVKLQRKKPPKEKKITIIWEDELKKPIGEYY